MMQPRRDAISHPRDTQGNGHAKSLAEAGSPYPGSWKCLVACRCHILPSNTSVDCQKKKKKKKDNSSGKPKVYRRIEE